MNLIAAVAIFWTKFGTPTDKYGSGTEEEIEEMLSSNKQVEGAVVEYSGFSECKLVKDKRESIISKIALLQQGYLNAREKENTENIEKRRILY